MGIDDDHGLQSFHHKSNYDVNSKIILAAIISLSLVVILVTILHIYARCVLRRQARRQASLRRLTTFANINTATVDQPKTGLDPSVIATLPIFIFQQTNTTDHTGLIECSVCLSIFEDGEMTRVLPNCKHTFHADCIDKWFSSNSTCPICRLDAEPRLVADPREGVAIAAPSAPPLEGTSAGSRMPLTTKINESNSRLSSFRRILSREHSSTRMQTQPCGHEDCVPDLERH